MARKQKKPNRLLEHMKTMGFTNRLSVYSLCFLLVSIVLGFVLAMYSVMKSYTAPLVVYTACVAPIGSLISISIGFSIKKSEKENIAGGIKYDLAMANLTASTDTYTAPSDEVITDDFVVMPDDEDLSGNEPTI